MFFLFFFLNKNSEILDAEYEVMVGLFGWLAGLIWFIGYFNYLNKKVFFLINQLKSKFNFKKKY